MSIVNPFAAANKVLANQRSALVPAFNAASEKISRFLDQVLQEGLLDSYAKKPDVSNRKAKFILRGLNSETRLYTPERMSRGDFRLTLTTNFQDRYSFGMTPMGTDTDLIIRQAAARTKTNPVNWGAGGYRSVPCTFDAPEDKVLSDYLHRVHAVIECSAEHYKIT